MHEPMETVWENFRVARISPATFLKRNLIHQELIRAALRRAEGSVLEVGIGSAAQSALLSRLVPRVVSVDNDLRIMSAARPNVQRYGASLHLVVADGFRLPFPEGTFGVALSQGLMEHFSDEQIRGLIREQLRVARSVVFSVPSDNYPRQDVGNERLLPPDSWFSIVSDAVGSVDYTVRARYYRPDLEALKYSILARRNLGGFSVLVTIDRTRPT